MNTETILHRLKAAKAHGSFIDIGAIIEELENELSQNGPGPDADVQAVTDKKPAAAGEAKKK